MTSHKARLETYKSDDEVKFGEDSILINNESGDIGIWQATKKGLQTQSEKKCKECREKPVVVGYN